MDNLNVLFWNIGKKDVAAEVVALTLQHNTDVLVLIENTIPVNELLLGLNASGNRYFFCKSNVRGISIYTSFNNASFEQKDTSSAFVSLVELKMLRKTLLFGAVHLPSKLTAGSAAHHAFVVRHVRKEIEDVEQASGHSNTILVGDFNMNPFEEGMVQPDAFNAAMCRQIAGNYKRSVSGIGTGGSVGYKYFYNPMWSFLCDLSRFCPGTYYYYANDFNNDYRWNMLDQVLIRPDLIPNFVSDDLRIFDKDAKGRMLIDTSRKSKSKTQIFDHLPVFFTLDLTK